MSRCIDADALIEKLPKEYLGSTVHAMINEAPTIEPKRGEWIDRHGKPMPMTEHSAYCSNCGEWSEYLTSYCGNCGADMRKESE